MFRVSIVLSAILAMSVPLSAGATMIDLGTGNGTFATGNTISFTSGPFTVTALTTSAGDELNQNNSSLGVNRVGDDLNNGQRNRIGLDPIDGDEESIVFAASGGAITGIEVQFFGTTLVGGEQFMIFADNVQLTFSQIVGSGDFWVDPTSVSVFGGNNVAQFFQFGAGVDPSTITIVADGFNSTNPSFRISSIQVVPLPAGVWMLLSGLVGLRALSRRRNG